MGQNRKSPSRLLIPPEPIAAQVSHDLKTELPEGFATTAPGTVLHSFEPLLLSGQVCASCSVCSGRAGVIGSLIDAPLPSGSGEEVTNLPPP